RMASRMPLFVPRGNGVMKQIAHEIFGPSYQNHVGFSNDSGSSQLGCRVGKARETEIVVWILVVLLVVAAVTAFSLLWHKAGGTENPIKYLVELPSRGNKS